MAKRLMIVQGQEYERPEFNDLTLEELEDAGLPIPTEGNVHPGWLRAFVVIAKRRAGEKVYMSAIKELKLSDITYEGDDVEEPLPPTNRAQRRASKNGKSETTHA